MGLLFKFNDQLHRGEGACQGVVSFPELEHWLQQVVRTGAQAYASLIDGREGELDMNPLGYRRFVRLVRQIARRWHFGPIAVLVADERSQAGVHTLGLLTQPTCRLRPFWQLEEAERWLASATKILTGPGPEPTKASASKDG